MCNSIDIDDIDIKGMHQPIHAADLITVALRKDC